MSKKCCDQKSFKFNYARALNEIGLSDFIKKYAYAFYIQEEGVL